MISASEGREGCMHPIVVDLAAMMMMSLLFAMMLGSAESSLRVQSPLPKARQLPLRTATSIS